MDSFAYRDGVLHGEEVALEQIAAQFGTPTYVYSRETLERHYLAYADALGQHPGLICYAVKANSNLAVLNVLARLGAGFDIVSKGELQRVIEAGGDPGRVVFSGVGKQADEMAFALEVGIHCFNVESAAELERLAGVAAAAGKVARVSLRVNPDVDAQTHPYISTGLKENKFGVAIDEALALYQRAAADPNLAVVGLDCHIGSQLTTLAPFLDALERMLALVDQLAERGILLKHLDLGGGLGVRYTEETPPQPADYIEAVLKRLGGRQLALVMEPGRSIAANAGVLLTRVEFLKPSAHKNFAIIDAAMNDLIRPALYSAYQQIVPARQRSDGETLAWDLVGPVCETGDFLGKNRQLNLQPGDLLVVRSAGAYGFGMSSNYNSRNRAAEVMVDGAQVHLARARETFADQIRGEAALPAGGANAMLIRFTKMHGLGNDFVVIDLITQRARIDAELVRKLGDRHFGIGFDQLLIVETPSNPDMDFRYRIFNANGSEVENCGNGARCFARFVADNRLTGKTRIAVETAKGPLYLTLEGKDQVRVDMGPPVLKPAEIPFVADIEARTYSIALHAELLEISAVSMGNPHGVLLVDDVDTAPVASLGPELERHPRFPARANIGFMQVLSRSEIRLRVFERGAGETLACGTGACAAVVAGQLRGLLDREVTVHLPGGSTQISWHGPGSSVIMVGPASTVYEGQIHI